MSHELVVELERVRYKLLRAFKALAGEGAITPEQFRDVAQLIERIEHVPVEDVRRVMEGLAGRQADTKDVPAGAHQDEPAQGQGLPAAA